MGKMRIRLRDLEFAHVKNFNGYDESEYLQWDRNAPDGPNEITIFTNQMLHEMETSISRIKIAFITEPEVIQAEPYIFIKNGGYKFADYVWTHNRSLLGAIPNGVWIPGSGSWCVEKQWNIYPKAKNVSIIASKKRRTRGHIFRHEIIDRFRDRIDCVCGNGYAAIDDKILGMRDFRYTIAVENSKTDYWFTEKIIDAFATGTVPIYWGCPFIGKFFNINGIIEFDNIDGLDGILSRIGIDDYNKRINAIKNNFEITKAKHKILEDYMYLNLLKDL